jgi:hypothetical protein
MLQLVEIVKFKAQKIVPMCQLLMQCLSQNSCCYFPCLSLPDLSCLNMNVFLLTVLGFELRASSLLGILPLEPHLHPLIWKCLWKVVLMLCFVIYFHTGRSCKFLLEVSENIWLFLLFMFTDLLPCTNWVKMMILSKYSFLPRLQWQQYINEEEHFKWQ